MREVSMRAPSVLVALSGGVDSAVAAWTLKRKGFVVVGVTFRLWEYSTGGVRRNNLCCSAEGIAAAKALCEKLGCEHIIEDVASDFFDEVVRYFLDEYRSGRTPNPCIVCNPRIKWRHLIAVADRLGIDKVATGHYARSFSRPSGGYSLLRGADRGKDQSYFLYRLADAHLARTLFPVGHLTKDRTRWLARRAGLPTASPRESQELCFLPDGGIEAFFRKFIPDATAEGPILDPHGKRVGTHRGIAFYTVGQRSGLGGGFPQPMYVLEILPGENAVVVGPAQELWARCFVVGDLVLHRPVQSPFRCTVRIRHRHEDAPANVTLLPEGGALVTFDEPQRAITPGQSAVFYDGLVVIGGGTIERVLRTA